MIFVLRKYFRLGQKFRPPPVISELESDENEQASGKSAKWRLKDHINKLERTDDNPFANTEVKFECFTKLMERKIQSKKLVFQYALKRLFTMANLIVVSVFLWMFYGLGWVGSFSLFLSKI